MDPKVLATLEFTKIVARLTQLCSFAIGKELAAALTPSTHVDAVRRRLALTSEATGLLDADATFTIGGVRDIREHVRDAQLGRTLAPASLLDVLDTLRAARELRARFLRVREQGLRFPQLADLVLSIGIFPSLEAAISGAIGAQGEVLDSASPELARLRSEVRVAEGRLRERMASLLVRYASALQEPIITERAGRLVIPVRITERARVPGVVHDTSSSGQTLFVEPLEALDLTNRWRQLQIEEQREVETVLRELSQQVGSAASALSQALALLGRIDVALAQGRYSRELAAVAPELIVEPPQSAAHGHPTHRLNLRQARHPLLGPQAVPIDLWLGEDARILIITGPNTGGKTVALKTVGLLVLMAQAGLHIPAAPGSSVSVFPHVFADIGDEQSIEQSLSTFSSHMSNIVRMFGEVGPNSLVLLDELGAGTDPVEGSALARAICEALLEAGPLVLATSHYAELKSFAYTTPGVVNASVEFDLETLSPTYRLVIGVPGRSNALAIASRLGLDPTIIDAARNLLSQETLRLDEMLAEVRADREQAAQELHAAEQLRQSVARERDRLQRERQAVIDASEAAVAEAMADFEQEVAGVRSALRAVAQEHSNVAVTREWLEQARARVDQAAARFQEIEQRRRRAAPVARGPAAAPGDTVQVRSLGQRGRVVSVSDGAALVQLGSMRTRLPVTDLQVLGRGGDGGGQGSAEPRRQPSMSMPAPRLDAALEVDIRGMRVHEIEPLLDRVTNDSAMANVPSLRIIHGKGTGALRQVVREYLRHSPLVASYETAPQNQGGDGVTIALFRS